MRVIFDNIIFSLQKSGGVSVYWYEVINRILNQEEIHSFFIEEENSSKNIFRNKLKIQEVNTYNEGNKLSKFLSRYREINFKIRGEIFIFHSTYYRTLSRSVKRKNNVKEIVTVHDFTYEHYGNGLKKWLHAYQKKKAIQAADIVICISENTKRDLLYFYPIFESKDIRVIYNGVSSDYFVIPEFKHEKEFSPYYLFVGSRASYKNFDFAVKAVAQSEKFILKIVGFDLNRNELHMLNELMLGRWELFINIENDELNELYNGAYALIYPSSYEGFGIPILESMKAGCPFIAMNSSSIPEVAGEGGVLLENLCIDEFNTAVAKITEGRDYMIELGLQQSKNFSWDKCYEETLNIYKDLSI
ncbi:glycosyltransferase family 1 protein [uncultured Flavobacterium sp.]|uniref:glycosyltransferase family 4 protein n=1 Tax=uncultured Flavobacterium sp. TaxID=165435 RepID=UPI0030EC4C2B|tara:strand:+ start:22926 stop:24002 length:1077 start_codon:yes stop_codon:yes gene_type:complete